MIKHLLLAAFAISIVRPAFSQADTTIVEQSPKNQENTAAINQDEKSSVDKFTVVTNPFWNGWYVQVGLDMSLQNPYGHDFSKVFPNGKSFGINAALGKWFTPGLGLRGRLNWENGIKILGNDHAEWLAPFYQPGENRRKGGYLTVVGDIQLDAHNLLLGYNANRIWNCQPFFRAGAAYNFGVSKGSPLIGVGLGNTFKINDKFKIYLDIAYQGVSSGFTGSEDTGTGVGSSSNGFFDISAGVQINLDKHSTFKKPSDNDTWKNDKRVETNSFWQNWYAQLGFDMTLMNPYGCDFSQVFPKGKTFGLTFGVGKWFSPEIGLRGRIKWDNGIKLFKNGHLEWVVPFDNPEENMDGGGYGGVYIDPQFNLTNIFGAYNPNKKWHIMVWPRAGVTYILNNGTVSPLVGLGGGSTYRINDKWSIFGEISYQVSTSEFGGGMKDGIKGNGTGMEVSAGSNGFLDFHLGIQYDLGKHNSNYFRKR